MIMINSGREWDWMDKKTKMSKEEIIDSLYDILDEINETPDDEFVDIVYIKETLENIINQYKE